MAWHLYQSQYDRGLCIDPGFAELLDHWPSLMDSMDCWLVARNVVFFFFLIYFCLDLVPAYISKRHNDEFVCNFFIFNCRFCVLIQKAPVILTFVNYPARFSMTTLTKVAFQSLFCPSRLIDCNESSAGPSGLCFVCLAGLIAPNFRSLCHILLMCNWSATQIWTSGTKYPKEKRDLLWFMLW